LKKIFTLVVGLVFVITMIFVGISCKPAEEAGEEAVEEAGEEAVEEEAVEEEAVEEEVVQAEEELYLNVGGWWGIDGWINLHYGHQAAEIFLQDRGVNAVCEIVGPMGDDIEAVLAGFEAAVARNPVAIICYHHQLGETQMLKDYADNGGIIIDRGTMMTLSPDPLPYKVAMSVGTNDFQYGIDHAKWIIDLMGDDFNLGIQTMTDQYVHRQRVAGMMTVLENYPNINIMDPYIEQGLSAEEAARNASAWIAVNGDTVDAIICTSFMGGSGAATALKEGGFDPGDILVLGSDIDPSIVELIKEGWIVGTTGQAFAVQAYFAVLTAHSIYNEGVATTFNDAAAGYVNAPLAAITPVFKVTAETADFWLEEAMPLPE